MTSERRDFRRGGDWMPAVTIGSGVALAVGIIVAVLLLLDEVNVERLGWAVVALAVARFVP